MFVNYIDAVFDLVYRGYIFDKEQTAQKVNGIVMLFVNRTQQR